MKTLFALFMFMLVAVSLSAQTNALPVTVAPAPAPVGILVTNATEALGALIHFEAPNLDVGLCIKIAGMLVVIALPVAKYLRKLIPDHLQINKFGVALATVAGEVNPTVEKLQQQMKEAQIIKANKPQ